MAKKKMAMEMPPGIPEGNSPVEVVIEESPTVTVTDLSELASVQIPLLNLQGYAKRRVDVFQTGLSAVGWKAAYLGLEQQEARLENGKIVANVQDAIRYVGE